MTKERKLLLSRYVESNDPNISVIFEMMYFLHSLLIDEKLTRHCFVIVAFVILNLSVSWPTWTALILEVLLHTLPKRESC